MEKNENDSSLNKQDDEKNEINITLKISKDDINKNIFFLDNTKYIDIDDIIEVRDFHNNLSELNESNVDLFINNQKYKYQKYFNPKEKGIYQIKLKFRDYIKDCHCMFAYCHNILTIDFSNFITKYVTDMSNMFEECYLTNIDLSSFDTQNVSNMSKMFYDCHNLKIINLSSFNTKNVIDMNNMFAGCFNLINIDLSSFNTKNAINMSYMFYECFNIKNINLSSFNTHNITNMNKLFF